MTPDVEVSRTFHPSFPSSFNFSLAALARSDARGLEQRQAGRFFLASPSDTVAEQLQLLHLPSFPSRGHSFS